MILGCINVNEVTRITKKVDLYSVPIGPHQMSGKVPNSRETIHKLIDLLPGPEMRPLAHQGCALLWLMCEQLHAEGLAVNLHIKAVSQASLVTLKQVK